MPRMVRGICLESQNRAGLESPKAAAQKDVVGACTPFPPMNRSPACAPISRPRTSSSRSSGTAGERGASGRRSKGPNRLWRQRLTGARTSRCRMGWNQPGSGYYILDIRCNGENEVASRLVLAFISIRPAGVKRSLRDPEFVAALTRKRFSAERPRGDEECSQRSIRAILAQDNCAQKARKGQ